MRFRRYGQDIMVVTNARNPLEAQRIATNVKYLVKTGDWNALDVESRRVAIRLFQNRAWKVPLEIREQTQAVVENELTLQQAARLCYQDPLVRTQSPSYRERLRQCFKNLYQFRGPNVPVFAITIQFVKEFVERRIRTGAASDTVRREKTALAKIFDVLIENHLADTNPVRLVRWRPHKRMTKARRPFIAVKDFRNVLDKLPDFYKPLALLAYYTGARQGEVRCLTLGQLDLEGRMIRLTSADTKEASAKRIPLRAEAVDVLKAVVVHRTPRLPTDRVFLKDGLPLERHHLKRAWEDARTAADFPNLRFHDLLHTWKTHAMPMDRGIRMAILGHAGGTHDGYGTLTDARLLEAIDNIDFSREDHSYGL